MNFFQSVNLKIILFLMLLILGAVLVFPGVVFSEISGPGEQENENKPYLGNVKGDDAVTVGDAIMVLKEIVGLTNLKISDIEAWQRGDVNLDGRFSVDDAIMILRHIIGLVQEFKPIAEPTVHTVTAIKYLLTDHLTPVIFIARDLKASEPLVVKRDITLKGSAEESLRVFEGELLIDENVKNFTVEDLAISKITLEGGDSVTLRLNENSMVDKAFFFSEASVFGGSKIQQAYIAPETLVDFNGDYPLDYIFRVILKTTPLVAGVVAGEGYFKPGDYVIVESIATTGYIFNRWESSLDFDEIDAENANTARAGFVMSGEDEIIYAEYRYIGSAQFDIYPLENRIWGHGWFGGKTITITLNDKTFIAETGYFAGDAGHVFHLFGDEEFQVDVGDYITVSDGVMTKDHIVSYLELIEVNADNNTISGKARPFDRVEATNHSYAPIYVETFADAAGYWEADISLLSGAEKPEDWQENNYVINPGDEGSVAKRDAQRDTTRVSWRAHKPNILINLSDNSLWGEDWPPLTDINVVVSNEDESEVFFEETVKSGPWRSFGFFFAHLRDDFFIEPGHLVTVTTADGFYHESHLVKDITILKADYRENSIIGLAGDEGIVEVTVYTHPEKMNAEAMVNGGSWSVNFPEETINPESRGYAQQRDNKGNATRVNWKIHHNRFSVNISNNYLQGIDWPEKNELIITVHSENEEEIFRTRIPGGAIFLFDFSKEDFTLLPGQVVTVTTVNGYYTKSHKIIDISVDFIDQENGIITGESFGEGVGEVLLTVFVSPDNLTATATVSDNGWSILLPETIVPGTEGNVEHQDFEGNATVINWRLHKPNIVVNLTNNIISGNDWPANKNLIIQLKDNNSVVYEGSAGVNDWRSFYYHLDPGNILLEAGQEITVTDEKGHYVRSYIIRDFGITAILPLEDSISGFFDGEGQIEVVLFSDYQLVPDYDLSESNWSASFPSGTLTPGSSGMAIQKNDQGDITRVFWQLQNPVIIINRTTNFLNGHSWPPEDILRLKIYDSEDQQVGEIIKTTDKNGNFFINLDDEPEASEFAIKEGYLIVIKDSSGFYEKAHRVKKNQVAEISSANDYISGLAEPESQIEVYIVVNNEQINYKTESSGEGFWEVEFADGSLLPGSWGYVFLRDEDGNITRTDWRLHIPEIAFNMSNNMLRGIDWPVRESIIINLDDEDFAEIEIETDFAGSFTYDFSHQIKVQPGKIITVTDSSGSYIEEHQVINLELTEIKQWGTGNLLTGKTGENDGLLEVIVYKDSAEFITVGEIENGEWTALFDEAYFKLEPGTGGLIRQKDVNGNSTEIYWYLDRPIISVEIQDGVYITGNNWRPDTTVTVSVTENNTEVFSQTALVVSSGGMQGIFTIDFAAEGFAIKPGQIVTVEDGINEKTHKVRELKVSDVEYDETEDLRIFVSGVAEPESEVELSVGNFKNNFTIITNSTAEGTWQIELKEAGVEEEIITHVIALIIDDNGNRTVATWGTPTLIVIGDNSPEMSNMVIGFDFMPDQDFKVSVTRDNIVVFVSELATGEEGDFMFDDFGTFKIESGDRVDILVPETEETVISHLVKNINISGIDREAGIVTGEAEIDSYLIIFLVEISDDMQLTPDFAVAPEVSGTQWEADFSDYGENLKENHYFFATTLDLKGNMTASVWSGF